MIGSDSMSRFFRMPSPLRRVLALDGGSRRLKLLLAESDFGHLRILKEEMVDLRSEGLVSAAELQAHLHVLIEEWGSPPLALVLPQHLSLSQIIDLPLAPESEVDKLIADETVKLSGVSESRIVYDFVRTAAQPTDRQEFWVTISQEGEIRDRIARLGVEQEYICEVTTTANALIAAYRAAAPEARQSILVHLGAQTTVVVILLGGQGAFASSFQMGSDFFTRALARLRNCSEEEAERLRHEKNFLAGAEFSADFAGVVDGWTAEVKQQLREWFQKNPAVVAEASDFVLVQSGGGFDQPGLLEYARERASLVLQPWPQSATAGDATPGKGFEIAFGTALQALGYSAQPVSLLPEEYRSASRKRQSRQRVELASFAVVVLCILVLAVGTWRELSLISVKQALLDKVRAGQESVQINDLLSGDLVGEYEALRPIFARQQNTIDTLTTFSLLVQSRSNRSFFYVLLSDEQSYFTLPPAILSTNRPAKTNLAGPATEPLRPISLGIKSPPAALTNVVPARPGLIAEICVPGEAEAARLVLSELVNGLKQQPLFSKVDLLSEELRRNLADPKMIVVDRHYVLALDFAASDFQQPARWKKPSGTAPARPVKRPSHPVRATSDPRETGATATP